MNHAFVITRGVITETRLDQLLREIVTERWGDLVRVERPGNWELAWGDTYSFGLHVWIETGRKIEMRKQPGDLSSWLQTVIQESLAARLNGKCGSEGISRRWAPEPDNWRTFRQWWDHMHERCGDLSPAARAVIENCYQRIIATVPRELLCTDD